MMLFYIIDNSELPNWSDALQALVGIIGVPLTIYTLWKLVKKDKEREAEIASLANIASELKNMMAHNHNVFLETKKPQIETLVQTDGYSDDWYLKIKNINPQAVLTSYEFIDQDGWGNRALPITTNGATQEFSINIKFNSGYAFIKLQYVMDGVYKYSQEIKIYHEDIFEEISHTVSAGTIEKI